jgi:hypothetical protein
MQQFGYECSMELGNARYSLKALRTIVIMLSRGVCYPKSEVEVECSYHLLQLHHDRSSIWLCLRHRIPTICSDFEAVKMSSATSSKVIDCDVDSWILTTGVAPLVERYRLSSPLCFDK